MGENSKSLHLFAREAEEDRWAAVCLEGGEKKAGKPPEVGQAQEGELA